MGPIADGVGLGAETGFDVKSPLFPRHGLTLLKACHMAGCFGHIGCIVKNWC